MHGMRELVSRDLLPYVSLPGQYIGGEVNQLPRPGDWERAAVRVAVAFPDTYTLGMSQLGCQILYWLCNHTPGVVAERVFAPWNDAEAVMRAKGIPLFTVDNRNAVADADILAISLQYEMGYTNVLTLLDLAGIPLRSAERTDAHPLVLAGGPQADAPEPLADFLDLIVVGDGEDSMAALLAAVRELKEGGVGRRAMIRELAGRFPWLYAPGYYAVTYAADGTIASFRPTVLGLPERIARCRTADLDAAPFPLRPLVPHVNVAHERIAIEIMRGCPQRCRFCHATYTKRPLARRSIPTILDLAEQAHAATGFDEIGLLSLSTADYPGLGDLAGQINTRFRDRQVSISVPSLRVDRMLVDIPWMVSEVRKSGLTLAIEAAAEDLRGALRKQVAEGDLLAAVGQAYQAGWRSVKLYFMAGFPGETDADIDGILDLSCAVADAARPILGRPAAVTASVGWLVPKPHTPLQWARQQSAEYFLDVRRRLKAGERACRRPVKIRTHNVERSGLEAVFSLGDRCLGPVVEAAWKLGARFDGWEECFSPDTWTRAFEQTGVDPAWYSQREKGADEVLPWAHIGPSGAHAYLRKEYEDFLARIGQRAGG